MIWLNIEMINLTVFFLLFFLFKGNRTFYSFSINVIRKCKRVWVYILDYIMHQHEKIRNFFFFSSPSAYFFFSSPLVFIFFYIRHQCLIPSVFVMQLSFAPTKLDIYLLRFFYFFILPYTQLYQKEILSKNK